MTKDELEKEAEEINITYENNVFHCTKNGTKWISIDGEKWYGEEKRITDLERENRLLGERCNQLLKDKGDLTDKVKILKEENNKLLDVINNQDVKIADLEKENQDLRDNYDQFKAIAEPEIERLQKENEKLNNFIMQSKKDGISPINALIIKNFVNQLVKAKEILEELANMEYVINPPSNKVRSLMVKAEQFLKEIEK